MAENKRYKVLKGIDYPPGRRAEPGDVVSDIPAMSIGWLLDQGVIEEYVESPPPTGNVENASGGQANNKTARG